MKTDADLQIAADARASELTRLTAKREADRARLQKDAARLTMLPPSAQPKRQDPVPPPSFEDAVLAHLADIAASSRQAASSAKQVRDAIAAAIILALIILVLSLLAGV